MQLSLKFHPVRLHLRGRLWFPSGGAVPVGISSGHRRPGTVVALSNVLGWLDGHGFGLAPRPASLGARGGGVAGRLGGATRTDLRSYHECLVLAIHAGQGTGDVLAAGAESVGDVGAIRRILSGSLLVVGRGAGWGEFSARSPPGGPRAALAEALPATVLFRNR